MKRSANLLWGISHGDMAESDVPDHMARRNVDRNQGYAWVLSVDSPASADLAAVSAAWERLEEDMSFVIRGVTTLAQNTTAAFTGANRHPDLEDVEVRAFYMDRYTVTNAEYQRFVEAGGYEMPDLWPEDVIPYLPQFVDQTSRSGPRFWSHGNPPPKKLDHPVVGINWYEAYAYARWVGKRLPTAAEWQWASSWAVGDADSAGLKKYPWGNSFDGKRANVWASGHGDTVPVDKYYDGATPNGIFQLVGNVWEWVAAVFACEDQHDDIQIIFEQPMAEIRGGAFDSYFETQATCVFRSGQPLMSRMHNVGFRCCLNADSIIPHPGPSDK